MRISILFTCLTALAAAACGSDGPGTGPVSADDAEAGCRRDCEHRQACDPQSGQTVEECTTNCVDDVTGGWVRADAFEAIIDCMAALECTASDDGCIAACEPTSSHLEWETQCRKVFATCGTADDVNSLCETSPTAGSDVGIYCLVTPSIMEEMTACIPDGTACQAGIDCVRGVLEAHHVNL